MSAVKKMAKDIIRKSLEPACEKVCDIMKFAPPGHFYSPVPGLEDFNMVHRHQDLEAATNSQHGIDFNTDFQLKLLQEISAYYDKVPDFPVEKNQSYRFYYDNDYYSYPDTTVMTCLMQHLRPKKIVDVGGGNTTTLMLDINQHLLTDAPMEITLIEPHPERIEEMMAGESSVKRINSKVQDCDLEVFRQLRAGDIVFLDTTHVSKMGSDVNYFAFNVFPVLQPGVIIHIHEMFYPFEYPKEFFSVGKAWNEIYFWRAFLTHNRAYEILLHNSFLAKKYPNKLRELLPNYFKTGRKEINVQNEGSSLWLRKR